LPSASLPLAHRPFRIDLPTIETERKSAPEDIRRQIGSALTAQRAIRNNPGVRHRFDGGGNGLSAPFASDGVVAKPTLWKVPHASEYRRIYGESSPQFEGAGKNPAEAPQTAHSLTFLHVNGNNSHTSVPIPFRSFRDLSDSETFTCSARQGTKNASGALREKRMWPRIYPNSYIERMRTAHSTRSVAAAL